MSGSKLLTAQLAVIGTLTLGASTLLVRVHAQDKPSSPRMVDYEEDVKPLLSQNCYGCHGPEVQQSGLRLDLRQNALRGGDYGPVIVAGKSADSKLIKRLVDGDGGMQMPPTGALRPDEIDIIRAWIDQGADFRNDVAEDKPPAPIDPRLAALVAAIRTHHDTAAAQSLGANPELVNAADAAGSTPLHHAAGFGSVAMLTRLLDAGAAVNAKNRRGSTPLHWAIDDEAKVRVLLARGASVNVKTADGRTPLYQAASLGNGLTTVKLLLAAGADPNIATANGRTPLMAAAGHSDVQVMSALVDAKANVDVPNGAGETALVLAASDGNPAAVKFLLDHGADARARTKRNETALGNAGTAGNEDVIRMLLDHGAEVDVRNVRGYSALMLAASSDAIPAGAVKALLAKGADTSFVGDYDETARDFAAKRGNTEVTRLLGGSAPAPMTAAIAHEPAVTRSIPDAVSQALSMVEKQSYNFIRVGGCNSCHSQDLPSAAAGFARSRGLQAPREISQLPQSMMPTPEALMDFNFVSAPGTAWELVDFGMNGKPRTAYTDAIVRLIKAMQNADGNWSANESRRPPMNAGDYQAAAVCIYALKHYAPEGDEAHSAAAIARATAWLRRSEPHTTQDRAFHAIALAWAGDASAARASARLLLAMQQPDGGWNQMPGLETDAYATGQALFALGTAGQFSLADSAFRAGIDYLRRTQAADGTWHVKSRSIWLQPYFESGFPYGRDQFISTAGTAWASMALSLAAPVNESRTRQGR